MTNKISASSLQINLAKHRSELMWHLLALIIIGVAFYFTNKTTLYVETYLTYYKVSFCSLCMLLCYVNMYILVPKLLFNGKPTAYRFTFLGMIAIAFIAVLISQLIFKSIDQSKYIKTIFIPPIIQNVFIATIFLGASTAIKLFQQWIRDSKRISELTSSELRSELEQLKNQINPHFLFNMLNNANVLIQKDPVKASEVLMKLSDLLRYQLYDSVRDKVFLKSDIQFLNDSLELEMIRRDDFKFTITNSGDTNGVQVPPFLFITFVENAIKHSLSTDTASWVDIDFDFKDNYISFICINSRPVKKSQSDIGGLGLKNVKRRLELLFPENHQLTIYERSDQYTVNLTIQL